MVIDTRSLAAAVLVAHGLQSTSLDNIRAFLGWSMVNAHTAGKDVADTWKLYQLCAGSLGKKWNLFHPKT